MIEPNWSEISKRLPDDQDTRVQTARLSQREFWIFKAACVSMNRSIAANSQSLMTAQIRRHQEEWFKNIEFLAAKDGVTFEEKFVQLCLGEDTGK